MSVTNQDNKVSYVSSSGQTAFPIPFYFALNTDIKLYINDVLQTTGYTISGAGNPAGGSLTKSVAPAAGSSVVILRDVPLTQPNSFSEGGPFQAKVLEGMYDRLTHIAQQVNEKVSRAIKFPLTSNVNTQMTGTVEPRGMLVFNSAGDGLECGPNVDTFKSSVESSAASAASSASSAASSATSAGTSASNAATSASSASASASSASTSATNAATSATNAATSETNANTYKNAASTSATAAATSATNAATSEANALSYKNSAQTSATNAATSETNANTYATQAGTSASNAATSATNAASSASAAAASASSIATVITNSTAGSETDKAASVAAMKTYVQNNAGGSGGSLSWEKLDDLSPSNESQDGIKLEAFDYLDEQGIYLTLNVPDNYQAGNPIKLKNGAFFVGTTSGKVLFRTVTALIRPGSTVLGTYSNTYTSSNAEVTVPTTLNQMKSIGDIDLTNGTGQINGVAVAAGDKLRVKLSRKVASESVSAAAKALLMINNFDVTFK